MRMDGCVAVVTGGDTAMAPASDTREPGTAEADAAAVLAEWDGIDALV
ncbi:hypothetical protein [Roseomonas sp. WA12]